MARAISDGLAFQAFSAEYITNILEARARALPQPGPLQLFNNDSTLTSAILDRVLHHAETVIIEGKSFRMKDEIDE
jgi:DNA replication protein DnaC